LDQLAEEKRHHYPDLYVLWPSRYPVIPDTREKKAFLNGLLIVQFTGGV
jgi:hypothetical protein